jgi:CheY-like chemotaxis protein
MQKESMLVIEDEDIMRDALADYFSGEGHSVDTAQDGDSALEKINFNNYNIMIIDLRLPGRDGLSILKEVRKKNPKAKVIMITAYPTLESETEARNGGALDYLTKPFEMNYLETLIRQSFEVEIVPTPAVEEPVAEAIPIPCIWAQAGIAKDRECDRGYTCERGCQFHAAMIKQEKFRTDERIQPFLEKLHSLLGKSVCKYTMCGELSFRNCTRLFNCASCELDQMVQYASDFKRANKTARTKKAQEKVAQVTFKERRPRTDH